MESKVQQKFRKRNSILTSVQKLYLTGSCSGKDFVTAKIRKLSINNSINNLPDRPRIRNIGNASYNLAKGISDLLSLLRKSRNSMKSIKEFIEDLKQQILSQKHKMISSDINPGSRMCSLGPPYHFNFKKEYEKN